MPTQFESPLKKTGESPPSPKGSHPMHEFGSGGSGEHNKFEVILPTKSQESLFDASEILSRSEIGDAKDTNGVTSQKSMQLSNQFLNTPVSSFLRRKAAEIKDQSAQPNSSNGK